MDVIVCIARGTRCGESNVLPLGPGGSISESWGDSIDLVVPSDFALDEPE